MFNELKRLLKQSAIYGVGSIVSPFIGFIMLPVYSRFLTPYEYGTLAVASVTITFLSSLVSLGISSGLIRFYFVYSEKKDRDEVIVSSLVFSFLSSVVFVAVLWPFSAQISGALFDFEKGDLYVKYVLLIAAIDTWITNCLAVLRAEERPAIYSVITVLRLMLMLSLNIVFVVVLDRKIQGVLEAQALSGILSYIGALLIAVRKKTFSFSWKKTREVLSFGLPLVPGNVASVVITLSDRFFLKRFATMEQVGLYSIGSKVSTAMRIAIVEPFRMAWPPYMFSVVEKPDAKEIYKKVLVYFTFVTVWVGLFLSMFAKEALMILATPAYYPGYRVVPLLVLSSVLVGMCAILVAGIQISNKTKYASYSFMIAAGVNLVMNFMLVPRLGMMGAAISSVTTYGILNLLYFIVSQRFYYIAHEFRRIVLLFVTGIAVYVLGVVVTRDRGLAVSIAVKLALVLLYPALLHLLRFFTKEERAKMREILKELLKKLPAF
ncbi:MAG: oligosaccharide flippase family protein [Candidatus Eisenbacteria bacterium]|nr:oligosaccharide flippase family protein [Candidatus Eisenbacteria bacterium]